MGSLVQPAEDIHLLMIGDEGVLFDEPSQRIFHLNTSAALIWCHVESCLDELTSQRELQAVFSLTEAESVACIQATYQLFKTLRVLKGFEKILEKPSLDSLNEVRITYSSNDFITERNYQLLSSSFCLRFSTSEQLLLVDPILSHLQHEAPLSLSKIDFDIVEDKNGGIHICRDNIILSSCDNNLKLAPIVKSLIWQAAVNRHHYFLNIHAGVISDGHYSYMFPASSGSGKSTLTAALVQSGFEYYSDEAALLHEPDFDVEPVPLAICVKSSGVEVLSKYYPQLSNLSEHHRSDGKKVRYMRPPVMPLGNANIRQAVAAMVFPRYCPTETTVLEPIDSIEALHLLMQECLIVDKRLTKDNVASLLAWIEHTPCYSLTVGNLKDAIVLIKELSALNDAYPLSNQIINPNLS